MKEFDFVNQVNNLPDCYAKGTESNNYKILQIENIAVNGLEADIEAVERSLDIDQATGVTLDLYGEMVNQPRGAATDAQYRLLIKSKIMQNVSTGDYKSVVRAICGMFSCEPSEVLIVEGENPCTVVIELLPLEVINSAGLTATQATAMIARLLPVGVNIESFLYEGTFELAFSYADMQVDGATKGLTDTYENMKNPDAIGGYLGITNGDENEVVLPI